MLKMSRENVKSFYEKLKTDSNLAQELMKLKEELEKGDKKFLNDEYVINEKIIPLAKKYGLSFTADEFIAYTNDQLKELSEEDLLNISGGVGFWGAVGRVFFSVVNFLNPFGYFAGSSTSSNSTKPTQVVVSQSGGGQPNLKLVEVAQAQDKLQEEDEESKSLEKELKVAKQENENLNVELKQAQAEWQKREEEHEKNIKDLEKELEAAKQEKETLQGKVEQVQAEWQKREEEHEKNIKDLEKELEAAKQEKETLQGKVEQVQAEWQKREEENGKTIGDLKKEVDAAKQEKETLSREIRRNYVEVNKKYEEFDSLKKSQEEKIKTLNEEIEAFKKGEAESFLKKEVEDLENKLKEAQRQKEADDKNIKDLEKKVENAKIDEEYSQMVLKKYYIALQESTRETESLKMLNVRLRESAKTLYRVMDREGKLSYQVNHLNKFLFRADYDMSKFHMENRQFLKEDILKVGSQIEKDKSGKIYLQGKSLEVFAKEAMVEQSEIIRLYNLYLMLQEKGER